MKAKAKRILQLACSDLKDNWKLFLSLFLIWGAISLIFRAFCPLVLFLGLPCPGCGLTRAALSLLTLHPLKAWEYNPSLYFWLVLVLAAAWQRYWREKPTKKLRLLLAAVALATLAVYLYRMFRYFPDRPPMIYREGNFISRLIPAYGQYMHSHFGSAEGMEQHIFR